jgi:hypothetical protein
MGAKYHTVHHTHYHYNFGQVSAAVCELYGGGATQANLFGCFLLSLSSSCSWTGSSARCGSRTRRSSPNALGATGSWTCTGVWWDLLLTLSWR